MKEGGFCVQKKAHEKVMQKTVRTKKTKKAKKKEKAKKEREKTKKTTVEEKGVACLDTPFQGETMTIYKHGDAHVFVGDTTGRALDIWAPASPTLKWYHRRSRSQNQLFTLERLKTVVATFNMAFHIQSNRLGGSEKAMVARCKSAFGNAINCTRVAASSFVDCKADIICLQEAVKDGVKQLLDQLHQLSSTRYSYTMCNSAAIIYNEALNARRVGKRIAYDERGVRDFVAIQVGQIVYASVWLGHLGKIAHYKRAFTTVGHALEGVVDYTRIIVGMDSNDCRGLLARRPVPIRIGQHRMHLSPHAFDLHTCCEDSDYTYPGDYIMDSDRRILNVPRDKYNIGSLYGIPSGALPKRRYGINEVRKVRNKHSQLMSDHLPVFYQSESSHHLE